MDDKQHGTHRDAAIGEIENIPKKQHMDEVHHKAVNYAVDEISQAARNQKGRGGVAEKAVVLVAEQEH